MIQHCPEMVSHPPWRACLIVCESVKESLGSLGLPQSTTSINNHELRNSASQTIGNPKLLESSVCQSYLQYALSLLIEPYEVDCRKYLFLTSSDSSPPPPVLMRRFSESPKPRPVNYLR